MLEVIVKKHTSYKNKTSKIQEEMIKLKHNYTNMHKEGCLNASIF